MNSLDRTPSLADEPGVPARADLRSGEDQRVGEYTTVRVIADGSGPATFSVTGEIDLGCADELTEVLCAALGSHPQGVDLDLSEVTFFDCRGLRVLLTARQAARRHGRHFAVGPHAPAVGRLLELTGTRSLLANPC